MPINLSTSFHHAKPNEWGNFKYSRGGNPTRLALERVLAKQEKAKYGLAYSSGCAAVAAILNLLKPGDHLLMNNEIYGGNKRYLKHLMVQNNISVTYLNLNEPGSLEASIQPNTKVLFFETPTNPHLEIIDMDKCVQTAHANDIKVVVDNTMASPIFQNPLEFGVDCVVHSLSKYINGHNDVLMGSLLTNDDSIHEEMAFLQNAGGFVPSPFDCYLVLRGCETLRIRMLEHERNTFKVARYYEKHPLIEEVHFPGLESHPNHELAKAQMSGYGGLVSLILKEHVDASIFLQSLRTIRFAASFGCTSPSIAWHNSLMNFPGISDQLVRLSIALTDPDDTINELDFALHCAASGSIPKGGHDCPQFTAWDQQAPFLSVESATASEYAVSSPEEVIVKDHIVLNTVGQLKI